MNIHELLSKYGFNAFTILVIGFWLLVSYLKREDRRRQREEDEWGEKLERNLRRAPGEPWEE